MSKNKEEYTVKVYDKNGRQLENCCKDTMRKLLFRDCAVLIADNTIKLKINNEDRKKLRKEIISKANRICYICGEKIPSDVPATIDHVVARYKQGHDDKLNNKCCCIRCNKDKGPMKLSTYVRKIKNNRDKYSYISKSRLQYLEKLAVIYDTIE